MILEICVENIASLENAFRHGADRVELCSALSLGGLSPALSTLLSVAPSDKSRVYVMIRPRAGDFCYSDTEFRGMLRETEMIRQMGFGGIVTGILTPVGNVDTARMREIIAIARPMEVTFHRAFDNGVDPDGMLRDLIRLGVNRVLTSGRRQVASAGAEDIKRWNRLYGNEILLMPGAGITAENIRELILTTGCREYHMSAKLLLPSAATDSRTVFPIPHDPIRYNDGEQIAGAKQILSEIAGEESQS